MAGFHIPRSNGKRDVNSRRLAVNWACQGRLQGRELTFAPTGASRRHPCGGVLYRLKNGFPTEEPFVG